jgi:ubiquinone/menaquinone biosynthesis C-methylase UbiE
MKNLNTDELETKIIETYREVAQNPNGEFHFEMGRHLAEKLGYSSEELEQVPQEAVDSFAGVGYHFGLANIRSGDSVLDLGSGSGMDMFVAALKVGKSGKVVGLDMSDEQLEKAETLSTRSHFGNVFLKKGHIEALSFDDESFDVVVSNGVINLSPEKEKVFSEVYRVLRKGGRMAISDIVTEKELTEDIVSDANLWASCIGGALQENIYKTIIEKAGMRVISILDNLRYNFLSESAQWATGKFGVKSISLLAEK